jgi:Ca-activated chloride channel family protein
LGERCRSWIVVLPCVLGALSCKKPPPERPAWSVIATELDGASWCGSAGDAGCTPATPGASHDAVGARLETGSAGHALVSLDDETQVELGQGASLALEAPRVAVARAGVVVVRRTPRGAEAPVVAWRIGGHDAELDASRPTTVAVRAYDGGDRATVTVEHGLLRIGGAELRAGDTASVAKGASVDRQGVYTGTVGRVEGILHEPASEASEPEAPRGLGTMTARVPGTEQVVAGVRLLSHHVRAVAQNGFARTEVEEVFANDSDRTLEGRYVFPIPPNAVTARLALWVGDKLVEDEVVERKRAAAIFKDVVDDTVRPRDPALLEWVASGELSLKVFPIPAKGSRKIVLAYDEVLRTVGGEARYVYPLSLGQARTNVIDDLSISVTATEADGPPVDAQAPSYPTTLSYDGGSLTATFAAKGYAPTADFALVWRRPKASACEVAGADGYGAARMTIGLPPGAVPSPFRRRDRVVVLDTSQSQSKETLSAEVLVAMAIVRALEPEESFALLACDSACTSYPETGLTPATPSWLGSAEAWAKKLSAAGSSDLAGALLSAASVAPDGGAQIVYVGDGAATSGELAPGRVAARVKARLEARKADLRFIGAGTAVDAAALLELAGELGATYQPLTTGDRLARRAEDLAASLRRPVVRAPQMKLPDTMTDVYPRKLPNLVLGEQAVVFGKLSATSDATLEISGDVEGTPWTSAYTLAWGSTPAHPTALVPRFWAAQRIDELVLVHDPKADKEAVLLSQQFHVLSRLTSMIVLENDAMYAAYGIRRTAPPDRLADRLADRPAEAPGLEASSIQALSGAGAAVGGGLGQGLGSAQRVSGPQGQAQSGPVTSTPPMQDAERVVAGMRAGFRVCYNRALLINPSTTGRLLVRARVLPGGEVGAVDVQVGDMPGQVIECIRSRVRQAHFQPPGASGAMLTIPIYFRIIESEGPTRPWSAPPPRRPPQPSAVTRASDEAWRSAGEDALAKLREASAASPESRAKREALLRGLLARGRFEEALTSARAFAEADPDYPAALDLLSYAAAASGDAKTALLAVDAVVETSSNSVKAHLRAARALEAAADERRACAHWRSLAELDANDEWRYQALRCRARTLGDRDAAAADARAIENPSKRVSELTPLLTAGDVPAYDPAGSWGGQMEVTVACEGPIDACPVPIVVAPNGTVFSPYTPADARSGPRAVAITVLRDGSYHALVVGGAESAKGKVTFRAVESSRNVELTHGGLQTVAASDVEVPAPWFGTLGWLSPMRW